MTTDRDLFQPTSIPTFWSLPEMRTVKGKLQGWRTGPRDYGWPIVSVRLQSSTFYGYVFKSHNFKISDDFTRDCLFAEEWSLFVHKSFCVKKRNFTNLLFKTRPTPPPRKNNHNNKVLQTIVKTKRFILIPWSRYRDCTILRGTRVRDFPWPPVIRRVRQNA